MEITLLRMETGGEKILGVESARIESVAPAVERATLRERFQASPDGGLYGVGIDIGTTTIAALLIDLESGECLGTASCTNPQSIHGGDVISRISYATDAADGLDHLQAEVISGLNASIDELVSATNVSRERIFHIVGAGNTTMEHCLLGVSPASIGRVPFEPQFYRAPRKLAKELNIRVNERAYVDLIPNIAGFIGGDLTSGIYYTKMYESEKLTLLIDIGTNNEMILGDRNFLLACSTAAGPALEGARIRDGMRAGRGAIEHVDFINGEIVYSVIGNVPPIGICGSGLVDIVYGLLKSGIVLPSGKMVAKEKAGDNRYAERLVTSDEGRAFRIAPREGDSGYVDITQKDIREVQLAKGAIMTGVQMLLERAGKELEDVESVLLAGAFGSYMDIENAVRLGIVPDVPREKIRTIGNSAGLGCHKALLDREALDRMEEIAQTVTHIELAASPEFQEKFLRNLPFGT